VAQLRSAGLPTAEAQERLEKLCAIHVKFLELEIALDPKQLIGCVVHCTSRVGPANPT
jgi:hypothetical protein